MEEKKRKPRKPKESTIGTKAKIDLIDEKDILLKAHEMDEKYGQVGQVVTATKEPVLDGCDICANVLKGKILNWSVYYKGEFIIKFDTAKEAVKYLKSSEI